MPRSFVFGVIAVLVLLAGSVALIAWGTGSGSSSGGKRDASSVAPLKASVVAPFAASQPTVAAPLPAWIEPPVAPPPPESVPAVAVEASLRATSETARTIRVDPGEPPAAPPAPPPLHRGRWAPDERAARLAVTARQPSP